jgi:cytochrome c556
MGKTGFHDHVVFHHAEETAMRIATILSAFLVIGLVAPAFSADSPEALVKYRQAVMKSIGGHAGAVASVIKGETSYGPHVAAHAQGIAATAALVGDVFPANSGPDDFAKTEALATIWAEPDKFAAAVEDFEKAAVTFAEVAEGGDMQATTAAFVALGKTCGDCHESFRHKD